MVKLPVLASNSLDLNPISAIYQASELEPQVFYLQNEGNNSTHP